MPVINRNKNQFRKVYPGVRRKPVYENLQRMEVGRLFFSNSDQETFGFSNDYEKPPVVVASTLGENANVSINCISVTKGSATFAASAKFTGEIHIHVLEDM